MKPVVALALLFSSSVFAWGFDGHRYLASKMQEGLPATSCLRQWYTARQTTALQDSACDPDRWRYPSAGALYDPNEGPRHYLETDWILPVGTYPRVYDDVVARIGATNASRNGIVPWRVEQMYQQLVADFASRDTTRILNTSFIMSHYVNDSFSVLHDTKNSDPNGIHSRWESDMLNSNANLNGIAVLAGTYMGTTGRIDARNAIFDVVNVGNGLNPQLLTADSNTTLLDGGHDMNAFYLQVKDLTARRWGDALTVMASILWQAWVEAGKPELTGFSGTCSRAGPTLDAVIVGFPQAGGFTKPDGGYPALPDAGQRDSGVPVVDAGRPVDAGVRDAGTSDAGAVSNDAGMDDAGLDDGGTDDGGADDGGQSGSGGGSGSNGGGFGGFPPLGGGGGTTMRPPSCDCSSTSSAGGWLLLGLVWVISRRRN